MKVLKRTLVALAGILLALLTFELGLRAGSALFFPRMMRLDDKLGWRHRADVTKTFENEWGERVVVATNAHGNRGRAHPPERRPGTRRVLVLGDSFTEAVQVGEEDLFTSRLEAARSDLEVINAGVAGYGTVQEYLYLRDEGLAFRPDVVLLMLYGNDLSDNVLPYSLRIGPRPWARPEAGAVQVIEAIDDEAFSPFCAPLPFRSFLYRRSYAFYALNDRVWQPRRLAELSALDAANIELVDEAGRMAVLLDLLARVRDLLAPRGIELVVFLIPTKEELAAGSSALHERVAAWCEASRVACIPGIPVLRAAAAAGRPYFAADIHWTREGHAAAAAEISRFLAR